MELTGWPQGISWMTLGLVAVQKIVGIGLASGLSTSYWFGLECPKNLKMFKLDLT